MQGEEMLPVPELLDRGQKTARHSSWEEAGRRNWEKIASPVPACHYTEELKGQTRILNY